MDLKFRAANISLALTTEEEQMSRKSSILVGACMVTLGVLSLVVTGGLSLIGFNPILFALRFWPAFVIAAGLAFCVPPFLHRSRPGLGGLFIPGVPILATGLILLVASVLNAWGIWAWLWPAELLAVATGFFAAGLYMRNIWLGIPAAIIGLNGMVFQFCAITGLWGWWSVLWTIEPLSVGLPLLAIGLLHRTSGLVLAGLILCGAAGVFFALMLTIVGSWLPLALVGPALLVLAGLAVLGWGLVRFSPRVRAVTE